jgi:hypothetical protein
MQHFKQTKKLRRPGLDFDSEKPPGSPPGSLPWEQVWWDCYFYRESEKQFVEKLIEERANHPAGTWRRWIEDHCVFTEGQARHCITTYEQETDTALIRARNAGARSLAWKKIKDRAEQFGEEVLKPFCRELFDSLEDDYERLDAQLAMTRYLESCCESVAEDGEGHQAEEEN